MDRDEMMLRVVVTYANGVADTIPVRHIFKEGSLSRISDLPGREGRAPVKVYGL